MNTPNNGSLPGPPRREAFGPGEDTLRLIASLPAPPGLADRVHDGLHAAPQAERILMGRGPLLAPYGWMHSAMVRGAAAAAIVCVVAGGGWRIYSHVQPPTAKMVIMPAPGSPGAKGFSHAGATRVPDTLQGPVLTHPVAPALEVNVMEKVPAQRKAVPGGATGKKKKAHLPLAAAPVQ